MRRVSRHSWMRLQALDLHQAMQREPLKASQTVISLYLFCT